jgi:hypothetical protein
MSGGEPLIQQRPPRTVSPLPCGAVSLLGICTDRSTRKTLRTVVEKTSWIATVLSIIDLWSSSIAVNLIAASGV